MIYACGERDTPQPSNQVPHMYKNFVAKLRSTLHLPTASRMLISSLILFASGQAIFCFALRERGDNC